MTANKVEIGFDLSGLPAAEFARLDDPFYGQLDAPQTILGGAIYQNVTPFVISYGISRGKSRQLDRYQSGKLNVSLNNNTRIFDPLYVDSPYRGQIIPKRAVRVTSNDIIQYEGLIDDWDLDYEPQGNSIAGITASDAFTQLANQTLVPQVADPERTGERILRVLQNVGVKWNLLKASVEQGRQEIEGNVPDSAALSYLQTLSDSEPGALFISKTGDLVFQDRVATFTQTPVSFTDDGSGIPYQDLAVVYGAELLYNEVTVTRQGGGTAVAFNTNSQEQYGISSLSRTNLPLDSDTSADNLATYLVAQYAEPEYRFEAITIELNDLSVEDQDKVLGLELADFVNVKFTPNNIPPAIELSAQVIRISHAVTPASHRVTLGLASGDYNFFQLSDVLFGRLSKGNALGY